MLKWNDEGRIVEFKVMLRPLKAVNLIPSEQRKGGAVGRRSQGAAFAVLALLALWGIVAARRPA